MRVPIGDPAPDFTQESTEGLLHFSERKGDKWAVLFSHPADFTPVCTTEMGIAERRGGQMLLAGLSDASPTCA